MDGWRSESERVMTRERLRRLEMGKQRRDAMGMKGNVQLLAALDEIDQEVFGTDVELVRKDVAVWTARILWAVGVLMGLAIGRWRWH